MPHARRVTCEARGLSDIVQEHRPAQHRLRRHRRRAAHQMLPDGMAVVWIVLFKAHGGENFRQKHADHLRIRQQHRSGPVPAEELRHLLAQPLRRDPPQPRRAAPQAPRRLLPDGKAKTRGKAQRPHHAQRIFAEAAVRLAHAADHPARQILPPAEHVHECSAPVERHGVDGEIPPCEVILDPGRECHAARVPPVVIWPVGAEGRHLDRLVILPHGDGAVRQACGNAPARKERHDLLRPGRRRHVPVVRHGPAQQVAHAPAHGVGRVSRVLQPRQHGVRLS